jgi:oligo-1,6-glucosidase
VHEKAFAPHDAFSVGETPGIGINMCQLVTGEERKELDMVFSFDHLETPGHVRMDDYEYDLNYYRDYMIEWMTGYGNNCWMSIFYNNHDNPRMVNKVTEDVQYHEAIMKLLAVMQMTLKGTPFIFQGDEMGLTNYQFTSMDQVTDVEAKGYYAEYIEKMSEKEAFAKILTGTREHTRVLLPWNEKLPSYHEGLVQEIRTEITDVYKELIKLRRENEALIYGDFEVVNKNKDRFVYKRVLGETEFIVDCNLGKDTKKAFRADGYERIFTTEGEHDILSSFEARIWKKQED